MRRILYLITLLLLFCAACVSAEEMISPVHEKKPVNNGEDMTRPLWRFDARYMFQAYNPGCHSHTFTPRLDMPLQLAKKWQLYLRVDGPFEMNNEKGPTNPNKYYKFGASDLLTQALLIYDFDKRWSWGAGSQVVFPTARPIQLGQESYQLRPINGIRCMLPEISDGSFFLLGLRYAIDCGGFDGRHYWNEFQISPELNVMFPKGWFVTLFPSPDIRISFENSGKLFLPLNIMVGKMFGEKMIMSTEFGFPMINDYYVYDFKMETRIGFFF